MNKTSVLHPFMAQSNNWTEQSPEDPGIKNSILSIKLPVGLGFSRIVEKVQPPED